MYSFFRSAATLVGWLFILCLLASAVSAAVFWFTFDHAGGFGSPQNGIPSLFGALAIGLAQPAWITLLVWLGLRALAWCCGRGLDRA